jgi:hypothetical protein
MRGAVFAETFKNSTAVECNNGTVSGTPTIDRGATFNGTTDYISYGGINDVFASPLHSVVTEFYPHFAADANANYKIYAVDSNEYQVLKRNNANNNTLRITISTHNHDIAYATYSPYWLQNERNVLVVSSTSNNTSAWLNGNNILDSATGFWAPNSATELQIGAGAGASFFDGEIKYVKIFHALLTAQEAADYYDETIYNYRNRAVADWPMTAATHDPSGSRTLDVSGNQYHAGFQGTPTKLATHGYNLNGSTDFFNCGDVLTITSGSVSLAGFIKMDSITSNRAVIAKSDTTLSVNYYLRVQDGKIKFYFTGAITGTNAQYETNSSPVTLKSYAHIAVTHTFGDSSQTKLFIDGREYPGSWNAGPKEELPETGSWNLQLGKRDTTHFMNGDFLEGRIWTSHLTPLQIADDAIRALNQINEV